MSIGHFKLAGVTPNHSQYPYVCADVESTGLNKTAEVIEIAMTEFNMDGEIGSTISYLCEPISGHIPEGASKVNGIYMSDVSGEPSYLKGGVREDCAEFLGHRTLVAHNASFDIRMMKIKPNDFICTLKRARERFKGEKNNLKAACLRVGIEWDDAEAHRATYDVKKCIEFLLYLENGFDADDEELEACLDKVMQEELF